jgi:hypothetical protein
VVQCGARQLIQSGIGGDHEQIGVIDPGDEIIRLRPADPDADRFNGQQPRQRHGVAPEFILAVLTHR